MFRKQTVPTQPSLSSNASSQSREGASRNWYAQAVLAFSPDEFNRLANGPEGPFVVFEPHAAATAVMAARNRASAVARGLLPSVRPTRLCYWQIT
jgi:hypothetical protein